MVDLESLVDSLMERLEADVDLREDPTLEMKSEWPSGSESRQRWQISDLVASMANDPHLDGPRTIVFGPASNLKRPEWLPDEAMLRPKLLKHFDGGVVPRLELIRRELADGRGVDFLLVVDRSDPPYVTRSSEGSDWAVRVRTNTGRRTATRAELLALIDPRRTPSPIKKLDLRLSRHKSIVTLTVTNVGTVACTDVIAHLPEDAGTTWMEGEKHMFNLADLAPGHQDGCSFFDAHGFGHESRRFLITVEATAEDGEPLGADILYSSELV